MHHHNEPDMTLFQRLFERLSGQREPEPKDVIRPLYLAVVAKARLAHWYEEGAVADDIDGRFDMVAAMLVLVYLRLEREGQGETEEAKQARRAIVHITELFVEDMEGQLREIGIGDQVVGKHMSRVTSAFGGRLGAYRDGFVRPAELGPAIVRNIYRGEEPAPEALAHVQGEMAHAMAALNRQDLRDILAGQPGW